MKLEQSFEVKAPVDKVWETLIDVQRVAPCLPGAEITDAKEDGTYEGTFQVKLGPTTAAYAGRLSMESLDESAHRATMKANGRDKRGQGSANATIVSTVNESGEGARVEVETDFTITGRLARFGRGGMMQDISNRLLGDFAKCLQEQLEAEEAAEPAAGAAAGAGAGAAAATASGEAAPASTAGRPPTESSGPAPAATGGASGQTAGSPQARPAAPASRPSRPGPSRPAKPVQGFSLVLRALVDRIKRLVAERRSRRSGGR